MKNTAPCLFAFLLLFGAAAIAPVLSQEEPRQWRVTEIAFTAKDPHAMPASDVRLAATFEGPGGERLDVPGFWDGGQTWKVRFTPTAPGKWTWTSRCEPAPVTAKVLFDSGLKHGGEPPQRTRVSLEGVRTLRLIVTDGGDGIAWDHADWADAKLTTADGHEVWLSSLKPTSARQGYDRLRFDTNLQGNPLRIGQETFAHGLGTHADSEITYDLKDGYKSFDFAVGVDAQSGTHGTIAFRVVGIVSPERAASPRPDAGLHNQRGSLTAAPAEGKNPLYAHGGFLRVGANRRFLAYSDGTPFFWLGDTWWWCPSDMVPFDRSNHPPYPSMYKALVDKRAGQGYTVVQVGCMTSGGGLSGPEQWIRDRESNAPDLSYWRLMDRCIAYANDAGVLPVLGVGFSTAMDRYSLEEWEVVWRYLVARYGAYAATWLICGEYNAEGGDLQARVAKVLALGQFTKEIDPYRRAMTVHPAWHGGDKRQAWDQPWCDFIMIQGAHDTNTPVTVYLDAWRHEPPKPVIEAECNYEGISSQWSRNRRALTDADVRWAAYRAMQSGCCGYTYGAHGLWYPKLDEKDTAFVKEFGPAPLWWQALELPGGAQMQHLRACYESSRWWEMEPRPDGILTASGRQASPDQAVLRSDGRTTSVVYFLKGLDRRAAFILKDVRPGVHTALWFDPRTGKRQPAQVQAAEAGGRLPLPDRPDGEDWLLLIRAAPGASAEEEVTDWQGGSLETKITRGGREAIRWESDKSPSISVTFDPPADSSGVGALRFWMYSEKDTAGTFTLVVNSDNPQRIKKGVDYYHYPLNIIQDWMGWREFNIPIAHMRPSSTPAGWNQVNRVAFQRIAPAGGVVILDGFRLIKDKKGMAEEDRAVFQRHKLCDHPRLLCTPADEKRIKELAARNRLLAGLIEGLKDQANLMLQDPPLKHGEGWKFLNMGNLCQVRVHTLALAYRMTGKKEYADRAVKEMLAAASLKSWGPNFLEIANLTCALAVGYDWLYPDLDAETRAKIRAAIVKNGLRPGIGAYERPEWWVQSDWNWNAVCNGGLIMGALAVAEDEPELAAEIVHHARWSLRRSLAGYYPNGSWSEGPDYHRYATTYAALAIAALESALGTDFDLAQAKGLDQTGLYRIHTVTPAGRYFNYGDCWRSFPAASPDMFWLARKFDRPLYAWWQRQALQSYLDRLQQKNPECMLDPHRFLATALALFDDRGDSPTLADLPLDMWFRGHTLVCMRSAWGDANALYVGFKGGSNANVSHGHLDAGSFILEADGVRWAVDMGPDNYDLPGYFDIGESGRRWSYYLANSLSHNTLVIGGQSQRYPGGGEVTVFASTPARTHAVMDLSSAYRGQAGKVLRGVAMLDRCRVLLRDELQGVAPGTRVRWGMVTHATVKIAESTATLTQDGKALRAEILEPAGARFEIVPTEQAHGDTFMTRDSRMIAIEVAAAADGPTEVAVLLTPVGAHWQSLPPPPRQPLAEWKEAANE